MKRSYHALIKGTNWILSGLMSLLGIASCNEPAAEYGTPHASYSVSGYVKNEAGEPVGDIKVELLERPERYNSGVTLSHKIDGRYRVNAITVGRADKFKLIVTDLDGAANGTYENDTLDVEFADNDYYDKGDGGWDQGSARKTVDIVLKKQP